VRISDSPPPRYVNATPVKVKEKVESRLMSEMRQHLVEMNRKKMLDRGLISERELAIIGKYSSLTGLATMDFSSETANSAHSSSSSEQDSAGQRLWRELLY